ncbi:MAG: AraC family transcriptional regulator ligand-binding domain-containing protein [Cyanobacteria bacterium P01_C01_bin.121]
MLTSIVANTFNYAVGRGLSIEQITDATGLRRTDLVNPETRLPEELAPTIWKLLGETYPGQSLALHAAGAAPFSALGQLAPAMEYAKDARSALEALVQYRTILSDRLSIELIESDAEARLQMHHPIDDIDGGYGAEAGMAMLTRFGKEIIGGESPLIRVNFKHPPFGAFHVYETFFDVPVFFQQPHNALVFYREALDRPTQKGDIHLFRYIKGNLELLQDHWRLHNNSPQISKLYEAITRNADSLEYSAEALAQQMNMSVRSLQRLTKEHGLTIRELLDDTRQTKAKQLLTDTTLKIGEISNQLGYSDERSFRRAFKRWTGKNPSKFRQRSN